MVISAERSRRMIPEPQAAQLLEGWGIPYVDHGVADDVDAAVRIADQVGYPVVLKVISPDIIHKTEAGGVVVDIADEVRLREGCEALLRSVRSSTPRARLDGLLVARHVAFRRHLIVGGVRDATFGPTVMLGLGGILAEAVNDVAFRVAPLRQRDGLGMVRDLRSAPILGPFRGEGPVNLDALANILVRVGDLLLACPEIAEIDLNPVAVSETECVALDARIITMQDASALEKVRG